jgi:hypothetical protein
MYVLQPARKSYNFFNNLDREIDGYSKQQLLKPQCSKPCRKPGWNKEGSIKDKGQNML